MISFTSEYDKQELCEIYSEWVKHDPQFTGIQINSWWVIAHDDSKPIGAAQLIIIEDPIWDKRWGLIENVYVKKGYRRKRIDSKLIKHLEFQARLFGCSFVKLATRKGEGKALYHSYEEGSSFRKDFKEEL